MTSLPSVEYACVVRGVAVAGRDVRPVGHHDPDLAGGAASRQDPSASCRSTSRLVQGGLMPTEPGAPPPATGSMDRIPEDSVIP